MLHTQGEFKYRTWCDAISSVYELKLSALLKHIWNIVRNNLCLILHQESDSIWWPSLYLIPVRQKLNHLRHMQLNQSSDIVFMELVIIRKKT